ncbi:tyrosine-type recombinase/integrase [Salinibius halmophilus]|uniref:tyrosine-type recombinase/integrase n=1 Tax=Salinibius halmophilus TaxID=1853216 RepID=UPI000E673332|nr:tyrosine-type recombinase/integrase [Salinibius halmophilus]
MKDVEQLATHVLALHQPGSSQTPLVSGVLGASNDVQAVAIWLNEFNGATQRNYRKEAERFLMWLQWRGLNGLKQVTRLDIADYQAFLAAPPASWLGHRYKRTDARWRPFNKPLSEASQRQAMIVLNAMFSYLVAGQYLPANPIALVRGKRRGARRHEQLIERYLEVDTWQLVWQQVQSMPGQTKRARDQAERCRFLFSLLYLLAPRVSEVANQSMNSFRLYKGRWWWFVTGKGGKQARVPVSQEMLAALKRYRLYLGLSELPPIDDDSPLLRSVTGRNGVTANMVYRIVKGVFAEVAALQSDTYIRQQLQRASTHWLRHTSITHADEAGVSLKHLSKAARHEKLETTAIYQHAEDQQWHDDWSRLRIIKSGPEGG